jgi:hypothetical protein
MLISKENHPHSVFLQEDRMRVIKMQDQKMGECSNFYLSRCPNKSRSYHPHQQQGSKKTALYCVLFL